MSKVNIVKDLLVNLRNGYSNKNKFAYCRLSIFCITILFQLYEEKLIHEFFIDSKNNKIKIKLKYFKSKPLITNINLISKPSLVNFSTVEDLNIFYKEYDYFGLPKTPRPARIKPVDLSVLR